MYHMLFCFTVYCAMSYFLTRMRISRRKTCAEKVYGINIKMWWAAQRKKNRFLVPTRKLELIVGNTYSLTQKNHNKLVYRYIIFRKNTRQEKKHLLKSCWIDYLFVWSCCGFRFFCVAVQYGKSSAKWFLNVGKSKVVVLFFTMYYVLWYIHT